MTNVTTTRPEGQVQGRIKKLSVGDMTGCWVGPPAGSRVWYGMIYVDLYSTIVANVSNALRTLVPREQPSFQVLYEGAIVLLCAGVVGQSVPSRRAMHSECSAVVIPVSCTHLTLPTIYSV